MENNTPDISLIIPIYQTEQYLQQCLDSVTAADGFECWQVLLIDDGSTDSGPEIAARAAGKYPNIALHRFENGGLSAARNRGLAMAEGTYVAFLDSDDLLAPDYFAALLKTAEETGAELVCASYTLTDAAGNPVSGHNRPMPEGVLPGTDILKARLNGGDWNNQVWCCLYRRSFLEQHALRFREDVRIYEDIVFTCLTLVAAEKAVCSPACGYLYRVREQSLVHSGISRRDLDGCLQVLGILAEQYSLLTETVQKRAYGRAVLEHACMTAYHIGIADAADRKEYFRTLQQSGYWPALRSCVTCRKERIKYLILRYCPALYYPLTRKHR